MLSLEDACTLVAARARLMQARPAGGAMVAVQASEADVTAVLGGVPGVSVAAVNGPASVVISGAAGPVARAAAAFAARGVRTRRLRVSHAFHSALMDPVLGPLGEAAAGLSFPARADALGSGLTGALVADAATPGTGCARPASRSGSPTR